MTHGTIHSYRKGCRCAPCREAESVYRKRLRRAAEKAAQPVRDDNPWQLGALCAQVDPELFFPEKGGSNHSAKAVCARCPVTQACLVDALVTEDGYGIRGGLSERERRKLRLRIA